MSDCSPDHVRSYATGSISNHSLPTFPPDDEGAGSKRPKMELSEEELRAHVSKGTLGKLTVPVLKEACRVCGLRGGMRKQELLDALTKHFQKD